MAKTINNDRLQELIDQYSRMYLSGTVERTPNYRYFHGAKSGHTTAAHCWNTEPVEEASGGKWWYWLEIEDRESNTITPIAESRLMFKTRKDAKAWAYEQSKQVGKE